MNVGFSSEVAVLPFASIFLRYLLCWGTKHLQPMKQMLRASAWYHIQGCCKTKSISTAVRFRM